MKRVVFVCVENSNRSQMAEAFARMYEGPHGEIEAFQRRFAAVGQGESQSNRGNGGTRLRSFDTHFQIAR